MDLIIKNHKDTPEEALAKAKARGAVILDEDQPGQGFAEDDTHDPRYDDPEVIEMENRAKEVGIPQEIDEQTQKLREENIGHVRKFRFNHQQDYLDWVPGRILHLGVFLGILQGIRPDAFIAEQQILGLQGLGFVRGGVPVYSGTSVQTVMPEWSQLKVDLHMTPIREKYRGWRTVLLACINGKFITEDQCNIAFGKPFGPRSRPWYRDLYRIKNGTCGECKKDICTCGADYYDFLRSDKYQYAIPEDVMAGRQQRLEESRIWTP